MSFICNSCLILPGIVVVEKFNFYFKAQINAWIPGRTPLKALRRFIVRKF
jgi:hypothetical protein